MRRRSVGAFAVATGMLFVAGNIALADRAQETNRDKPAENAVPVARDPGPATGPGARTGAAMVALDDGGFLLFGGQAADGTVLGDTWVGGIRDEAYYPDRVGFTLLTLDGPPPRWDAAIAADHHGRVFMHGGFDESGSVLDDTWVWDRGVWHLTDKDPRFARAGHRMIIEKGERVRRPNEERQDRNREEDVILMFGGVDGAGNALHDTVRGTIRRVLRVFFVDLARINMSGPSGRSHFSLVLSDREHRRRTERDRDRASEILLFGGMDNAGNPLRDTWRYFADTNRWEQEANSGPVARFGHSMVYDADSRRFIMFGGTDGADAFADTWALRVVNRPPYGPSVAWILVTEIGPTARARAGMAYDDDFEVSVLFGGQDAAGSAIEDVPAPIFKDQDDGHPAFWTIQVPADD